MLGFIKRTLLKWSPSNDQKPPIKPRFSVSLVYIKHEQKNSELMEFTTSLRVLITDASSKEEALGKAINEFKDEQAGYRLSNQLVLPVYKS